MFVSCHVVFDEDRFLFAASSIIQCVPSELDRTITFVTILHSCSTHKSSYVSIVAPLITLKAYSSMPTNVPVSPISYRTPSLWCLFASPFHDFNLVEGSDSVCFDNGFSAPSPALEVLVFFNNALLSIRPHSTNTHSMVT